ncbi:MAG: lipoate--protein ligase [Aeromicrobium sp.]
MTARTLTLIVEDRPLPGGPADDVLLGPLLLARGMGDAQEIIRIFRPEPTAAFSRRDSRRPGYGRAAAACRELGFKPVIRPQGGQLAAYHRGSVVIDHVVRTPNPTEGLKDRFRHFARLHADVLSTFGVDVRVGELPGEYCPGEFSINVAGVTKIVGSAQRITRDGWLFSTIIQAMDSASIREVLTKAYDEIGYELNVSTIGSVEDYRPDVTADAVEQSLIDEYSATTHAIRGPLAAELLDELASMRPLFEK